MCDDIDTTVGELKAKGAQFRGSIEQTEYGWIIMMIVPGADDIQLYQPSHKLAYNLQHTDSPSIGCTLRRELAGLVGRDRWACRRKTDGSAIRPYYDNSERTFLNLMLPTSSALQV